MDYIVLCGIIFTQILTKVLLICTSQFVSSEEEGSRQFFHTV